MSTPDAVFPNAIDFHPERTRFLFDLDLRAEAGLLTEGHRMEMADWLRRHATDCVVLYHGTDARLPIAEKGLLPTTLSRKRSLQSTPGYVYLTYDPRRARTFAELAHPMAKDLVVWAAIVPLKHLKPDTDQLFNKRLWGERKDVGSSIIDSLAHGGGARVRGKIPPEQLVVQAERHAGNPWNELVFAGTPPAEDWSWRCMPGWRDECDAGLLQSPCVPRPF